MKVKSYRDLIAWQKAIALVTEIYRVTERFPRSEVYGLAIQLQRAAVSVPSNIAEGQGRRSTRDFIHFLGTAQGSLFEAETQLTIAENLGYLSKDQTEPLLKHASEVGRILNGLIDSLENSLAAAAATGH